MEGMTNEKFADQHLALSWFKSLEPVLPDEMTGLWKGRGIPSGHPLDGVLENLNWFGKRFHPDQKADALLFQWQPRRLVAIEPSYFPIEVAIRLAPIGYSSLARKVFAYGQRFLRARGTTASLTLRASQYDDTAAMVYDKQPITDYFRRIGENKLAGMMVAKGDERHYFFSLERVFSLDDPPLGKKPRSQAATSSARSCLPFV